MDQAHKDFYTQQREKLVPSTFKRAVISRVNITAWTADVQVLGGTQTVFKNVPMSSAVPPNVQPGDRCIIDTPDETNPNDCIVAYTYGKNPKRSNSGVISLTIPNSGGTGTAKIAHGLGAVPNIAEVSSYTYSVLSAFPGGTGVFAGIWVSALDTANITVTHFVGNSSAPTITYNGIFWFAAIV